MNLQNSSVGLGVAAVAAALATYFMMKKRPKQWKKVGTVSKLFIYPVKSTAAVEVDNFFCHKFGPSASKTAGFDRGFFIVNEKRSHITARQAGQLLLTHTKVYEDHITLSYEDKEPIDVPIPTYVDKVMFCKLFKKDVLGIDCGEEVSKWLSEVIEQPCKLVYCPHFVVGHQSYQRHFMTGDSSFVAAFADESPFNILSEESVKDLNSRLDNKVSHRNFRTNILVKGCSQAFAEDLWKWVKINGIEFQHIMRTGRCLLTTVDPDTGVAAKNFEPLKTLRKYRQGTAEEKKLFGDSPKFGNHLCSSMEGVVSVGDDVYCLV